MSNFFTSLEDLRTLGAPRSIKRTGNGVTGIEDLGRNYSRGISDVEECVEMAVEDISLSNQFGLLVASNVQYVEAVSRVVEGRNNYVRHQKTMGNESFSDVKMIRPMALSTEGKVGDWFKKIWEGIKEAFRRLIVAIGNIIRTVIAWFKKATVKRQAKVYEYYKNVPLSDKWQDKTIKCHEYQGNAMNKVTEVIKITSAQSGHGDKIHDAVEKYLNKKEKTASDKVKLGKEVNDVAVKLFDNFKVKDKHGKEVFSKWSGTAFFNSYVFGKVNPEKKEQKFGEVMKGITGSEKGFGEVLSTKASAEILKLVGVGRKVINGLSKDLKFVEKLIKKVEDKEFNTKKYFGLKEEDDGAANKKELVKSINKLRWYKGILTNNLLGSFMAYVKMRTIVFNIFMKSIKGDNLKNFKKGVSDKEYYKNIRKSNKETWKDTDKSIKDYQYRDKKDYKK